MLESLAAARHWLANLDPAAPAVTLMLGVFLTIYSIRRWFPRVWIWVEKTVPFVDSLDYRPAATILWKAWQAWPAVALGATVTALSSGGSPVAAVKGAALGAAVAAIHELVSAYKGKVGTPKPRAPSGSSFVGLLVFVLTLVLACGLPGCSVFGPGSSVWPKIGECLPSAQDLLGKVESVLKSSGSADYEKELLDLGKAEGFALVECAVQQLVSKLSAPAYSSPNDVLGFTRGKTFLAKIEAQQ